MRRQFEDLNLPVTRWSAVDGQHIDIEHLVEIGVLDLPALLRFILPDEVKVFGIDLTPGGIGCALSHMQIWSAISERHGGVGESSATYLIIEDDCRFLPAFSEAALRERLAEVPPDWEVCWLGGVDFLGHQDLLQVSPGVRRVYSGFRTTTAYAITVAGAISALEACTPLTWQLDTMMTRNEVGINGETGPISDEDWYPGCSYTGKPVGYSLYPPLVEQAKELFGTDVQKDDTEHRELRGAHPSEIDDTGEPLLLLGSCNDWSIDEAREGGWLFQRVAEGESSLRVEVPMEGIEFQVISARRLWDWRLFAAGGEDPRFRELRRGDRDCVLVGLALGKDNTQAHGRDFVLPGDGDGAAEIRVSVSKKDGFHVWYT